MNFYCSFINVLTKRHFQNTTKSWTIQLEQRAYFFSLWNLPYLKCLCLSPLKEASITLFFCRHTKLMAKVIFIAPVCHSVHGGCLPQCMLGYPPRSRHPLGADIPQLADTPPEQIYPPEQTHPPVADTPPRVDTTGTRHLPEQTPPGADSGIRSMSGRYASYWNCILVLLCFFAVIKWSSVILLQRCTLSSNTIQTTYGITVDWTNIYIWEKVRVLRKMTPNVVIHVSVQFWCLNWVFPPSFCTEFAEFSDNFFVQKVIWTCNLLCNWLVKCHHKNNKTLRD